MKDLQRGDKPTRDRQLGMIVGCFNSQNRCRNWVVEKSRAVAVSGASWVCAQGAAGGAGHGTLRSEQPGLSDSY